MHYDFGQLEEHSLVRSQRAFLSRRPWTKKVRDPELPLISVKLQESKACLPSLCQHVFSTLPTRQLVYVQDLTAALSLLFITLLKLDEQTLLTRHLLRHLDGLDCLSKTPCLRKLSISITIEAIYRDEQLQGKRSN